MFKLKLDPVKVFSPKKIMFRVMLWLMVSCSVLLLTPPQLLAKIALDPFVAEHAEFVGLGLIVSIAYFLSQLINLGLDESIRHLSDKRVIETIESKVNLLDPAERALVREFFLQGATILTLPQNETAVKSLVNACILEKLGNERHYAIQGPTADYKIAMKARMYLNRDVLRLPAGEPSQEEMQSLIKARPQFLNGLVQNRKHTA
ncbi:superinfection exclusion B family protein [Shewanella glacialipiscicola]|uniref:superinfection exclusion B family protein n=1 Tax=Shewanella glacialipiscicola TaxID=614069 RepID=UPI003D7A3262